MKLNFNCFEITNLINITAQRAVKLSRHSFVKLRITIHNWKIQILGLCHTLIINRIKDIFGFGCWFVFVKHVFVPKIQKIQIAGKQ